MSSDRKKIVILKSKGEGCDYTIGCNIQVVYIDECIDDEDYIKECIDDYHGGECELDTITISTIKNEHVYYVENYINEDVQRLKRELLASNEEVVKTKESLEEIRSALVSSFRDAGINVDDDVEINELTVENLTFALKTKIEKEKG